MQIIFANDSSRRINIASSVEGAKNSWRTEDDSTHWVQRLDKHERLTACVPISFCPHDDRLVQSGVCFLSIYLRVSSIMLEKRCLIGKERVIDHLKAVFLIICHHTV